MISYDNYKNRIEKLAKAKRIIHKFRFLIIGALALVIAVSVGLMLAKGSYMSAMTLSAQNISFNESYEVTPAKAFLASARSQRVEYSIEGSDEWTTEKPVKAGKYLARTVSPKIVGYSYSTPVAFEITPLDANFEILGDSMVYGELPEYYTTGLISGHSVDTQALDFAYDNYGADSTRVDVVQSSFKIIDRNGEDFTSCYNVTFSGKQLDVTNRALTVKPTDKTVIYDGTVQEYAQSLAEATVRQLAKGDEISFETSIFANGNPVDEIKDAGDYEVRLKNVTVMHGSKDVTAKYDITQLNALFKVEKRKITVTTASESKPYDGKPLANTQVTSVNLAEGHRIVADSMPYIVNVGLLPNNFTVTIMDAGNRNVTSNYETPTYRYGTLEVIPCEVTVTTNDDGRVYNGNTLYNFGFTLGAHPEGFTFSAIENGTAQITDYGTVKNVFEVSVEAVADGKDVTSNFKLSYVYGTLSIKKRAITVTTGDSTRVFDGQPLSNDGFTVTKGALVDGQRLVCDKLFTVTDVTAAGGVDNTTTYKVKCDNDDVSGNYDISYVYGKLTVNVRRIIVYTNSSGRIYDGTPYSDSTYKTTWEDDGSKLGLLSGTLTLVSLTEIIDFGNKPNACEYTTDDANYEIATVIPGTIEIYSRPITVKTASAQMVYNGEELSAPDYEKTFLYNGESGEAGLIGDDRIALVEGSAPSILNFGSRLNDCAFTVPNSNYKIVGYEYGTLEILQRHIIVITATDYKEYDGGILENTNYQTMWTDDTAQTGLIGDDVLTPFTNNTQVIHVGGPVNNVCSYYTPLFDGVKSNYVIDQVKYGTLTINPRPIIVWTASESRTYDGNQLSNTEINVYYALETDDGKYEAVSDGSKAGLVGDDKLTLVDFTKITDVGKETNVCHFKHENEFGRSNYDIHYYYGTLEVTVRKIVVVTSGAQKIYDGIALTAHTYDKTYLYGAPDSDGLLNGEILTPAGEPRSILNYGSIVNDCKFVVPNGNYQIVDYDNGTLEILQREIKLITNGKEQVYDGQALSDAGYTTELFGDGTQAGLIGGDKITVVGNPSIINAGEIDNKAENYVLPEFEAGKTNYKIAEYEYGKLTVLQRKIKLITNGKTQVYSGQALSDAGYTTELFGDSTQAGLIGEDKITVVGNPSIINVGERDNEAENYILPEFEAGKTNYQIAEYEYGKLTVTPAPLTVKPLSYSSEGDRPKLTYGDTFVYEDGIGNYRAASGLVNGEQLEISVLVYASTDTLMAVPVTPVNAGTYLTVADAANCIVYDSDGNVIEGGINNYELEKAWGSLSIVRKKLNITIGDDSCVYGDPIPDGVIPDGKLSIFDADGVTEIKNGNLPYNETLSLTYGYCQNADFENFVTPKNVGEYDILYKDTVLYDKDGNPIENGDDNYLLVITYGTLTVAKYKLELSLEEENLIYGIQPSVWYTANDSEALDMPYGEVIRIQIKYFRDGVEYKETDKFNRGAYEVVPQKYYAYDAKIVTDGVELSNERDALDNYEIECANGVLNVLPKPIKVKIDSVECIYGDRLPNATFTIYEYDFEGNEVEITEFPYGDNFALDNFVYKDGSGMEVTPKNVGDYTIAYNGATINLGTDGLDNYDVSHEDGTLTVKSKPLAITIDDKTAVYGDSLPANTHTNTELAKGDVLTVEYRYDDIADAGLTDITPKNVGKYVIFAKTVKIGNEEIPCETEGYNYYITVTGGSLEIPPRAITVVLKTPSNVTYGKTFAYADEIGNYVSLTNIGYGEQLKVAVKYFDGDGNGLTAANPPKNAGTYSAQIDGENCVFYEADGTTVIEDGLNNYIITCDPVNNLKINRANLSVVFNSFTGVQYGEWGVTQNYPTGAGNYEIANGLKYGEDFEITVEYKYKSDNPDLNRKPVDGLPKNVGEYYISSVSGGLKWYASDGSEIENGWDNYIIFSSPGLLEIVPREITVELKDLPDVRYGDILTKVNYPTNVGNYERVETTAFGEQLKFSVTYQKNGVDVTPQNVGEYEIVPYGFTVYDKDGNKIEGGEKNYVRVGYTAGTLTIVPREIEAFFAPTDRVYGEGYPDKINLSYLYDIEADGSLTRVDGLPYANEELEFAFGYEKWVDGYHNTAFWFGDTTRGLNNPVTPRNVGTYAAVITGIDVKNGSIDNYKVKINTTSFDVTVREIDVVLNPIDNVTYGVSFTYKPNEAGLTYANAPDLAYGEKLTVAVKYFDGDGNGLTAANPPKNAGTYSAQIDEANCIVYEADGTTVIDGGIENYGITCSALENLVIREKRLCIQIDDQGQNGEIVYGDKLPDNTFKIYDSNECVNEIANGDLPYGETIGFVFEYLLNSDTVVPKNAGSDYRISIDFKNLSNILIDGAPCEHKNYAFSAFTGKLTISKKTLNITLTDKFTFVYGFNEFIAIDNVNSFVDEPYFATVEGEDITLGYGEQLYITVDYFDSDGVKCKPKNKGEYTMRAKLYTIATADGASSDDEQGFGELTNYIINCGDGKLTITPKALTVTVDDQSAIYGDKLPVATAGITDGLDENGRLPYGEQESLDILCDYEDEDGEALYQPNVGSYTIAFKGLYINLDAEGAENYAITHVNGTLTVSQRDLIVDIKDKEIVYGGEKGEVEYSFSLLDGNGDELQNELHYGEKLNLTFKYTQGVNVLSDPQNVGKYAINIDVKEVTGGNGDIGNYNVRPVNGTLNILPKPLVVEIDGDTSVYGEEVPHSTFVIKDDKGNTIANGGLPYGESLDFVYSYKKGENSTTDPVAAGTYDITAKEVIVTGGNGSAGNYDISYGGSPVLVITPRPITVELNNGVNIQSFTYGENYGASVCNAKIEGLYGNQIIKIAVIYSSVGQTDSVNGARRARAFAAKLNDSDDPFIPRNVGVYTAELDWDNCKLYESDGVTEVEGGMNNYALADGFECEPVTFTIVRKTLNVTIHNSESIYGDKLPLGDIDYETDVTTAENETLELTFAVLDSDGNPAKNVGSYPITVTDVRIFNAMLGEAGEYESPDNYEIKYVENNPTHEIKPREINVTYIDQNVTYGNTASYPDSIGNYKSIDNLADGESLKISVTFRNADGALNANPTEAGNYDIVYVSFEVYGKDGNKIEGGERNYDVVGETGTLEISSRVITVKSGSASKIYDGKALTSDSIERVLSGVTEAELAAEGYKIVADEKFGQIHATGAEGADNITTYKVVDGNGDATANYVVTVGEYGKFIVTARPITVTTDSATRDYNGDELTAGYTVKFDGEGDEETFGKGDTFSVTKTSGITNAGSTPNAIAYVITNARGEDVTDNDYSITYSEGTLTVNKLAVKITLDSVTAQYGEKFDIKYTLDCGSLPNGETLGFEVNYVVRGTVATPEVSDYYFILARGIYNIELQDGSFTVDGEADKAGNYELSADSENPATLTVERRQLKVTTNTSSRTYNGSAYTDAGFTVVWAKDNNLAGLLGDDMLTVTGDIPSVTDADDPVENALKFITPSNYMITEQVNGFISIDRRVVGVQTADINGDYDGSEYSDASYKIIGGVALVHGHTLEPLSVFKRAEATGEEIVENDTTFKVMSGSTDVSNNYKLEYTNGKVVINKRELAIKTNDITAGYDGTAHYDEGFEWEDEIRPVLDHKLQISHLFTWTNATVDGNKQNTNTYRVVGATGDVTSNYNISVTPGAVVINQARVTVTLADVSVDYGDSGYAAKLSDAATVNGVVGGETLNLAFEYSDGDRLPNQGVYTVGLIWNNCTVSGGARLLSNYYLVAQPEPATLTVNKKQITVTVNSAECNYGEPLPLDKITYSPTGLVYGESLVLTFEALDDNGNAARDAGEYGIAVKSLTVAGGSEDNYEITYADNSPKLTVKAIEVAIELNDLQFDYNNIGSYPANVNNYKNYDAVNAKLAYNERLQVVVGYERNGVSVDNPRYAGEYDIVLKDIIVYADNGDVIDVGNKNYTFLAGYTGGTLTINGISLVVTRKPYEKTYDGEPIKLSELTVEEQISYYYIDADGVTHTQFEGDYAGYSLRLKDSNYKTESADAGSYENTAEYAVYYGEVQDPTGMFVVEYNKEADGKLTITPREIVVVTADASKIYDGGPLEKTDGYKTYLNGDVNADGLLGSDALTVAVKATRTDAGESANDTTYTPNGNYVIVDYKCGTLTVKKRKIKISTVTSTHVYDGTLFSDGRFETVWADDESKSGLVGNDKLTLVGGASSIENVGTVPNKFGYELPLRDDGQSNYEVVGDIAYGTLTVTPRKIVVVTADGTKIYDGQPLKNVAYVKTYLEGDENAAGLLNGATLTADSTAEIPSIINVGNTSNNCKFTVPSSNYEIAGYVNGTLTVTKKPLNITLSMENSSYAYGDAAVKNFTVQTDGLVDGENLTVKLSYKLNGTSVEEPRTAGGYTADINLTASVVRHNNGTDLANGIGNYEITCNTLTFTIGQKNITVNLEAWANEVYNGKAHGYSGAASVVEGLEYGENITSVGLKFFTDAAKTVEVDAPVNAGTYYVELDASATLLDTLQSLDTSYNVTCGGLTFIVEKSELEITLSDSLTQVYNGASFDFATAIGAYSVTGLAEGERLEITVRYEQNGAQAQPKNAGTYDVIFVSAVIAGDENGIANYDLVTPVANGSVEITRRKVALTVNDRIVEKGGESYGANDIAATPDLVAGELEAAVEAGEITFDYKEITDNLPDGATAQYVVSLVITDGTIMSNYDYAGNVKSGTLTVTNRRVLVTPELKETGRIVYTGEALSSDLFGFSHMHISEGELADGDLYGFVQDDLENIQATYTFVDGDGTVIDGFPVNAGTYSFTVKLSGTGAKSYFIEYSTMPAFVTIDRRTVDISISYSGSNTHVYDGKMPDLENNATFSIINGDTTDGFVNGDGDTIKFALVNGSGFVGEFSDVGKYTVCVSFNNISNYSINAIVEAEANLGVEITQRIIVVLPLAPSGGLEQYYNGKPLTLDSDRYELVNGDGVYDSLAEGDVLTVISSELAPTTLKGYVQISGVIIKNGDRVVTDNYSVHCVYNANDRVLQRLHIIQNDMRFAMSYKKFDVTYNQEINGVRLPYTGATQEYDISGTPAEDAVTITGSNANGGAATLFPNHRFVYSTNKVTVSATAGTYANWLAGVLKVYEGDMDVTVLYNFTCANAGDMGDDGETYNGKPIIVVKNTLTVTLKNVTLDMLDDGTAFTTSPIDNNVMLKSEYYEVEGLLEQDGAPVHTAEVLAFKVGDRWLLGVTVFRKDNKRRTDMIANYEQTEIAHSADFDARYIAVSEISTLLKPVLNLEINVTAEQLKNGYGTVFVDGGIKGSLKLNDSYYSHGALQDGDKLEVLVFKDNDGNYKLGVAVYRNLGDGRYSNARDNYNRMVTGTADVAIEFINVDNIKTFSRDLYIDLSATFDENGEVVTGEDGEPVFTAHGLYTDDLAQITVVKTADGEYTVTVKVVSTAGASRTGKYEINSFGTLPAGVTVNLQKAA